MMVRSEQITSRGVGARNSARLATLPRCVLAPSAGVGVQLPAAAHAAPKSGAVPSPARSARPAVVALLLRRWLTPASQRAIAPGADKQRARTLFEKQKQKQKPDGESGRTLRFLFMVSRRVKGAARGFATCPWKTWTRQRTPQVSHRLAL